MPENSDGTVFKIENVLENLQSELAKTKKENEELKKIIAELQPKKRINQVDPDIEEVNVASETAWILPKKKKRKMEQSSDEIKKDPKQTKTPTVIRTQKPPPIVVSNLVDYSLVNQHLQDAKFNYKTNMLNNNQLKINVESDNEYRKLTKLLNESEIEWHSYENKQARPIRVMVRNLHPTCKVEEIKEDLENMNLKIIDVTNKLKKTKVNGVDVITPLPLFMLTFENTEDIKKIYEIQYLCHMRVKIEALKGNNLIPQCKRCQRYGHTQRYCQRQPACVKCAGNHITAECTKPKTTAPKCYNCAEEHPANYRGCMVAKELQKRRDNIIKNNKIKNQPRIFQSRQVSEGRSYLQATQNEQSSAQQNNNQQPMLQMMQQIMTALNKLTERMDRLEATNTGAFPRRIINE